MIQSVNIFQIFPRFILEDKDGFAMCKALEAGMKYFLEKCQDGLNLILDVDEMPEWRLDELAWEYNILYDYDADVEIKRKWIANAMKFYSIYGTPAGIVQYLKAAFDNASIEEWTEYGGDPYHFRVNTTGEWSVENDAWARKSIAAVKNVRSVLDAITFNAGDVETTILTLAAPCGITITNEVTAV